MSDFPASQHDRATRFRALHARPGTFVIPNPWDAGSAQMLAKQPQAMQLRYLQTLGNIAGDRSSTIVFPVPIDLVAAIGGAKPSG